MILSSWAKLVHTKSIFIESSRSNCVNVPFNYMEPNKSKQINLESEADATAGLILEKKMLDYYIPWCSLHRRRHFIFHGTAARRDAAERHAPRSLLDGRCTESN